MSKTSCKYHPQSPARWHCAACGTHLCAGCVKAPERAGNDPTCHSCQGTVESLGLANSVVPFWERIPRFFAYPAKPDALAYIGMLSVATLLAYVPIAGAIIYLVISYALLQYGYLILNHTARGNATPPGVLGSGFKSNENLPLKQAVVFLIMFLAVAGFASWSPAAGLVALLFVLFSIPASVMSLAINGRIGQAMDPMALGAIMKRIGWPYLILYVFLMLLSGASTLVQELLVAVLPVWLVLMTTTFVSGYFTIIMFNMIGYVVYQYHEELGFDDVKEFDEGAAAPKGAAAAAAAKPADPFEAELNVLINEGQIDEAKERLRKRLRGYASTPADHDRFHRLLQVSRDAEESSAHGQEYLRMLVASDDLARAIDVYADCVALDSQFRLDDGSTTLKLAERAHGAGKNDLALRMLARFAQRFQGHPGIPQAYLLAARLLCEHKGDDRQALKILDSLLREYADHALAGEIGKYRTFVKGLVASEQGAAAPAAG